MSVWSRSHSDLAKLAKTLQDSNSRTRRRLSSTAIRTRSLSPKTHQSTDAEQKQSQSLKAGSVHDVSRDPSSSENQCQVMNGETGSIHDAPFRPQAMVSVTSMDGSEGCYSDVFLQSSASDCSDVFHSVTSPPDAGLGQHRGLSWTPEADDAQPSASTAEESKGQHTPEIFTFSGSSETKTPESDTPEQSNVVYKSIDSGIGIESLPTTKSPVPSDSIPADVLTDSKEKVNDCGIQNARRESNHLCAIVDPSTPRLSARSPDLLKKLREVTSSISANKNGPKVKTNKNEREFPSEMNFSPASKEKPGLANNNLPSSEKGNLVYTERSKLPSSEAERPCSTGQPDKSDSSSLQSDRREETGVFDKTVETATLHHSLLENSTIVDVDTEFSDVACFEKEETDHAQNELTASVNEDTLGTMKNDIGEDGNSRQSCPTETSVNTEIKDLVDGAKQSDTEHSFSCQGSSQSHSGHVQNSNTATSLLGQTLATAVNSIISVSVSQPLTNSNQTVTTISATCTETIPLSVSFSDRPQSSQDSFMSDNSTVSMSSPDSSQLTVHDLDLRLVPLSAIGIMIGLNGSKYEVTERLSCFTLQTSPNVTMSTGHTDSMAENAQYPHRAVGVSSCSEPLSTVVQTNAEQAPAVTHHQHQVTEAVSHCTSVATHCCTTVLYSHSNSTVAVQGDTAVVPSLCDAKGQQHWQKTPPDKIQLRHIASETPTIELKTDINDVGVENFVICNEQCIAEPLSSLTSDKAASSSYSQPYQTTEETEFDTSTLDPDKSFSGSSSPTRDYQELIDPHSQVNNVTIETQTAEIKSYVTSLGTETVPSDDSSFTKSDSPNVIDANSQRNQVTSETQTAEMESDMTMTRFGTEIVSDDVACIATEIMSNDDSSFRRPESAELHNAQCQPNQVTTETQTVDMNSDVTCTSADISSGDSSSFSTLDGPCLPDSHSQPERSTAVGQTLKTRPDVITVTRRSSGDSPTPSRTEDSSSPDSLDALNHASAETQTVEMNSTKTSGSEHPHEDSSSHANTVYQELSGHHPLQAEQSIGSSVGSVDKLLNPELDREIEFVQGCVSSPFDKEQHDEKSFTLERKSGLLFGSKTGILNSQDLQEELVERVNNVKDAGIDASVTTKEQPNAKGNIEISQSSQRVDQSSLSSLLTRDGSYCSGDSGGMHDLHTSHSFHCLQGQQHDSMMTEEQQPSSNSTATSISLYTKYLSSTKHLSQTLGATGTPETSPLYSSPFSSVCGQTSSQTGKVKHRERLRSESETEKSVVSASVQVSLSGTSEQRSRSSRSHRRRARARDREGGSTRKNVNLSQSQTSFSSSSVDSLLSLSDNGSGSSYCSDVLHYLTSSSRSQGQTQGSVSRRRLKKLLSLLRPSDQSTATEVSGLSDFSRTVADLHHLCLFLSRNLELQTQQQLLEQQQQRLREHQQQLLKEQASQEQQHCAQDKEKRLQHKDQQAEAQPPEDTVQQNGEQEHHSLHQEQQEQPQQEQGEQNPTQGPEDSGRQPVKDQSQTKLFLKLRVLNQATQRRGVPDRSFKKYSRTDQKSPDREKVTLQQTVSRFHSLALTAADLNPEVLIEEACKNTELLERLGVDKDVFGTGKEGCSSVASADDPQQPLNTEELAFCGGAPNEGVVEEAEGEGTSPQNDMETPEEAVQKLDEEFDKLLVDMKPHVLKLPHKSDRQRCAVWIKKLCEPPSSGITGRKNRNMYSQLMLHMLKRGSLQDPFDRRPEEGPLPPLPSYMSIYFDEPLEKPEDDAEKLPDWVEGELGDTVGSSLFRRSEGLGNPAATSTWVSTAGSSLRGVRQRPHTSMGITLDKDPGLSPIRGDHRQYTGYSAEDVRVEVKSAPTHSRSPTDRERRQLPDVKTNHGSADMKVREQSDLEWTRPLGVTASSTTSFAKGALHQDDTSIGKPGDKEIALRTKMIEAKYHEEKLRLQQKHDAAVQKILDRKNSEIEDVKSHYRSKTKELEETITKLERRVQTMVKEAGMMRETKDKQIGELKKMVEDSTESQRNEYEKRMHDLEADFEQQKFELQKLHTRNIQEILDDTNARLQRMDAEYNQQAASTTSVIKDLEARVQQLMGEVDRTLSQRSALEKDKAELQSNVDRLTSDLEEQRHRNHQLEREHQKKLETSEHEMRTLRNKTEASLEYLKQEHSIATAKAADSIADLEQQVDYLKKALKDAEEQRQRQMRETEQVHQQDKLHLENLHDKQVRSMKKELEQLEQEMQRKLSRLEQLLQDKEGEVQKQKEAGREQAAQADKALEDFKLQVEKNQAQIYADMRQQMEQVGADLKKSKQAREKQSREFNRQLEEIKYKHEHELTEMKMNFDNEKAQLLHEVHMQKEYAATEHERDMEQLREGHRNEIKAIELRYKERQDKDAKVLGDLENQVAELREELVQSNQLRKQQLVELGLLREEEKQKMQRDHEAEIGRMRGETEQQRLELQKMHSTETEKLLEKTNDRLKSIEREYMERGKKSSETITELQNSIKLLRDDIKRAKEAAEDQASDVRSQSEEEKLSLKKQYASNLSMVQHELESQRSRCHNLDRQIQRLEADHEEKVTRLKLDHEDRIRGMLPAEMKQELEDTISSLKSQVNTLQQRAAMLQEELDMRLKNPLGAFGSCSTSSPIKSSV